MENQLKLQEENYRLRNTISQYKQVARLTSWLDDGTLKGGYRVVKSIQERDAIDSCHRKIGMIVSVQESETEYTNYRLIKNNTWIEVTTDGDVPGPPGPQGPIGDISVINFQVNDDMHLIMDLQTNSDLNFELKDNGRLILI